MTVLLVDDDAALRRLVSRMLVEAGHEVREAAGGKAGIALYRQERCNLVLTDIVMPDMEGLAMIKELRKIDPAVRVIAMSGAPEGRDQDYLNLAAHFGAHAVIQKPFTRDELLGHIARIAGA